MDTCRGRGGHPQSRQPACICREPWQLRLGRGQDFVSVSFVRRRGRASLLSLPAWWLSRPIDRHVGTPPALAAKQITTTIRLFSLTRRILAEPVVVQSLARRVATLTGTTTITRSWRLSRLACSKNCCLVVQMCCSSGTRKIRLGHRHHGAAGGAQGLNLADPVVGRASRISSRH